VIELLRRERPQDTVEYELVPDEEEAVSAALRRHLDCDYIFTSGGTGIGPRDITPEATLRVCSRELPGIAEWLRRESLQETPFAVFSRGVCAVAGKTIVVNFPGSVKGALFCARLLLPVLEHGPAMLSGGGH